jgi:hypothetical protein
VGLLQSAIKSVRVHRHAMLRRPEVLLSPRCCASHNTVWPERSYTTACTGQLSMFSLSRAPRAPEAVDPLHATLNLASRQVHAHLPHAATRT